MGIDRTLLRSTWSPAHQTRVGIQDQARRLLEISSMRSRVPPSQGRRLQPNVVWHHAWCLTPPPILNRRQDRHEDAPLGFRRRLPAGRVARGRGRLLPASLGRLLYYRKGRSSHGVQDRQARVWYGASRTSLATLPLPVVEGVRLHPDLTRQQRLHSRT